MIKYYTSLTTFAEVPDEITLAIDITNCPHRCPGCHSQILQQDVGQELTPEVLDHLLSTHKAISCVSFMGGDADHEGIIALAVYLHKTYPKLRICMYSGNDYIDYKLASYLDYYKVGSWQATKGPLNSKTTNQKMYKVQHTENTYGDPNTIILNDITDRFLIKEKL
jgi:anaerobic ribonucleoside-triphosphate reductase activating protein